MAPKTSDTVGHGSISEPFIKQNPQGQNGSLGMVLFSTCIAVCGSFIFGTCVGYSAPTQYGIMEELGLSYSQYSVFGSILNIGAMIGAITSGRIADVIGRKGVGKVGDFLFKAMRLSSTICIAGWLAIYYCSGSLVLDSGRFLTGFGTGIYSYVSPVFIAEITPKDLRGAFATTNQLLIVIGLSAAYVIGAFVTWRVLALAGTIPCLIMLFGLFFIPESPRWLAMIGKTEEFEVSLQKLRGSNADISEEKAEIQECLALLRHLPKVTIFDMLERRNFRLITIGVGLMVFQQCIGINGIVFYADHIFASAGVSPSLGSILYASLQVLVTALGASLVDKAGRRPLLIASAFGLLLGNLILGTSFFLKDHHIASNLVPALALTGVMEYIAAFSIGMGAIPWVLMSELFPLNVKGTAGSLVTLVNWLSSWVVSFTFNFLMGWSSYGTFYMYAIVCVLSIIFIIEVVPETKGRTLEEIHTSVS